jgi:hypothetical protein
MIGDLKEFVNFLVKHQMTAEQFLFCCLIYEKQFSLLYKIHQEREGFDIEAIRNLEDRGYVKDLNKSNETYADMYIVTEKFTEAIYCDTDAMFEELINTYPMFFYLDQKKLPAQSCDLDKLKLVYFNFIKRNPKKHKKIIEALNTIKAENGIYMGIEKWVTGRQWRGVETIQKEQENDKLGEREF